MIDYSYTELEAAINLSILDFKQRLKLQNLTEPPL